MRISAVIFITLIFFASGASAAIYRWTDDKGTVHATDAMEKIPPEYKDRVKVIGTEERPEALPRQKPAESPEKEPGKEPGEEDELYGDQPLSWWRAGFYRKKKEIENAEGEYGDKKQFVEVFEKGRRFGQVFEDGEIETYNRYKKDLPEIEKKVEKLKKELDELRGRARYHGVPKEVRGE